MNYSLLEPHSNGRESVAPSVAYAGIEGANRTSSISVKINATRLRRFQYVFRRLVQVGAAHLPSRKDWDLKLAIARHLYEDAEQATTLLNRILELRVIEAQVQKAPDASLVLFMDEVIQARTDAEFLLGIYEVVRPLLLDALIRHREETQQLVDYPTVRALKFLQLEMEEQLELGRGLIHRLVSPQQRADAADYVENLRKMLGLLGGFDGTGEGQPLAVHRWRSEQPFVLPKRAARPDDFGLSLHYRVPGCLDENLSDAENAFREMMRIRQEEMTAAELIAGVLYEATDMPWDFYRTLARHIWDEARHAAFGQAALEEHGIAWRGCPHYTAEYEKFRGESPGKAYAFLSLGVETSAMAKSGKQHEVQLCQEVFQDPLMTLFQDYDWADEVQHAGFGRTWATAFFDEGYEQSRAFGQEAWMELLRYRASLEPDRDKYHTMFYLEKFGKMPSMKATDVALSAVLGSES